MTFEAPQRDAVESAIKEVCKHRQFGLYAINIRTNHAHVVVSAKGRPEAMMNAFKAYATRRLRGDGLIGMGRKVWSRHGSTRYLWTEEHISRAVHYVLYEQGDELPHFD